MVLLEQYINENARTTSNNKERKKELEEWLKNKNYPDYVDTLNKMLDDPKAKTLLQDGFGGQLGDTKFVFSVKHLTPGSLRPTQSEIDIDKSLKHVLKKPEQVDKFFSGKPLELAGMPIITFRGNYVIDGHHRWSEACMVNPDCELICFDYDAKLSPIQMLKAVQGSIAAVMADDDNDNNQKIPSNKVEGANVFDMTEEDISEYVNTNIIQTCCNKFIEVMNDKDIKSQEDVIQYLIDNVLSFKSNNYPEDNSPNRGEMPQPSKAGTKEGDKSTAQPDSPGSALNKLKTGKVDKEAIK